MLLTIASGEWKAFMYFSTKSDFFYSFDAKHKNKQATIKFHLFNEVIFGWWQW